MLSLSTIPYFKSATQNDSEQRASSSVQSVCFLRALCSTDFSTQRRSCKGKGESMSLPYVVMASLIYFWLLHFFDLICYVGVPRVCRNISYLIWWTFLIYWCRFCESAQVLCSDVRLSSDCRCSRIYCVQVLLFFDSKFIRCGANFERFISCNCFV